MMEVRKMGLSEVGNISGVTSMMAELGVLFQPVSKLMPSLFSLPTPRLCPKEGKELMGMVRSLCRRHVCAFHI